MHTAFFISSSIFLASRTPFLHSSLARSIARAALLSSQAGFIAKVVRGPIDHSDTAKSETDLMSASDFYYN